MKTLTTNSLFYGKYPYKVVCRVPGGAWRWRNKFNNNRSQFSYFSSFNHYDENNGEAFYKASEKYFNGIGIKTRVEHALTSFYFKDQTLIEEMKKEISRWIIEIHQPFSVADQDFLLNNPKKVLCDQYPKRKYKYCIYLKCSMPSAKKESFYDWIRKNASDKISITDSTIKFLSQKKYYGDFYIRVEDEKTLLLINMFLAEYINKTLEYVLRDNINTEVGTQ